jgi:phosphate starvation-inducible PhoH-like protein
MARNTNKKPTRRRNKKQNNIYDLEQSFVYKSQKPHSQLSQYFDNPPEFLKQPMPSCYNPVVLKAKNSVQEILIDHINDDSVNIIAAIGPAGTGKTFVATLAAIQQLQDGLVERIVITRPAVSVDEDHGFLPGTLEQKMAPWTRPIFDVFREFYTPKDIERMITEEVLEISPLAYMRGRSFKNCFILADELQLTTPNQMLMLLTRIGEGSKLVLTGDLKQSDRLEDNGLKDFLNKIEGHRSGRIKIVRFLPEHIERHPVVEEILGIYDEK